MNHAQLPHNTSTVAMFELPSEFAVAGEHLIASIRGALPGPTLLIMGGVHGNEPAGVLAIQRVLPLIRKRQAALRGELVLLRGNTRALEQNIRYIDADLNREWRGTEHTVRHEISELAEKRELLVTLRDVVSRARGEIYFLDLHTTSAHGKPFATVGDTLRNRHFALQFPLTIVLGLEEQIEGTLLEHLNNRGAITLGFEGGQHEADSSVDHHQAVIWSAAVAAGSFRREDVPELDHWQSLLRHACGGSRVIEVRYRHSIQPEVDFRMQPGFRNFQPVSRGQLLATDRTGEIRAGETGLILMPLYQALGDDGFFRAREVKRFWLSLSALLRKLKVGNYVHLLAGVRRDPDNKEGLIINTRIARFLPLQIFHLLGFRRLRWTDKNLFVSRRAYDLAGPTEFTL